MSGTALQRTRQPGWQGRPRGRAGISAIDAFLAVLAGALVFAVHNVGYLLRTSYFIDETWVIASTRMPLADLRAGVGSSPVIWTLLLRWIPFGGPERQRIVPLLFAGAAVAVGYLLLRTLDTPRAAALIFGAGPVLLSPAMLLRDDLKQYTADAFVFVFLLVVVARAEQSWSRSRVLTVGIVVGVAPGISSAALFGGTAAMLALLTVIVARRQWERLRDYVVAAVVAVGGSLVWLLVFILPNTNVALTNYWVASYPPRSVSGLWHFWHVYGPGVRVATGIPYTWLLVVLVLMGVVTLLMAGRPALALVLPAAAVGSLLAGLLRLAPFLDERTSTWLWVGIDVYASIGVWGLARALLRRSRRVVGVVAVAAAVALAGAFAAGSWHVVRSTHVIIAASLRRPAQFVSAHRAPEDVVVVNFFSSFAYAYYSNSRVTPTQSDLTATNFYVKFPAADRVLMVPQTGINPIGSTLQEAEAMVANDPGARVWMLRYHLDPAETLQWNEALATRNVTVVIRGSVPVFVETPDGG